MVYKVHKVTENIILHEPHELYKPYEPYELYKLNSTWFTLISY